MLNLYRSFFVHFLLTQRLHQIWHLIVPSLRRRRSLSHIQGKAEHRSSIRRPQKHPQHGQPTQQAQGIRGVPRCMSTNQNQQRGLHPGPIPSRTAATQHRTKGTYSTISGPEPAKLPSHLAIPPPAIHASKDRAQHHHPAIRAPPAKMSGPGRATASQNIRTPAALRETFRKFCKVASRTGRQSGRTQGGTEDGVGDREGEAGGRPG